jgi:hypothetical protein
VGTNSLHDRRPGGDGAAAQIIAVRKTAWKHRKIGARGQGLFAMPDYGRVSFGDFLHGAERVLLAVGTWEENYGGFHVPVNSSAMAGYARNPPLAKI